MVVSPPVNCAKHASQTVAQTKAALSIMRFKTRLVVDKIPQLLRVIQVVEKLDRRCVLHLPPPESDTVRIIVQPDISGSMASYAIFDRKDWFESYRIESQNANQIGLELEVQNLLKALRSGSAADEILVKLSKKGGPVLTFEIRTPLGPILQDVPVSVLSAIRLAECCEPENESVTGFTLPPLAKLHTVIDRMKGLGNDLEIDAEIGEEKADLSLGVHTDMVNVSSMYRDLNRATFGAEGQSEMEHDEVARCRAVIDRRNFSRCLYGHQLQPKHAICFVFQNSVMVHLMGSWGVTVTYYIPKRLTLC